MNEDEDILAGMDEYEKYLDEREKYLANTGFIFCPYIPLIVSCNIDIKDFTPRKPRMRLHPSELVAHKKCPNLYEKYDIENDK